MDQHLEGQVRGSTHSVLEDSFVVGGDAGQGASPGRGTLNVRLKVFIQALSRRQQTAMQV